MKIDIDDVLTSTIVIAFYVTVLSLLTLPLWVGYAQYHFNKSDCSVWVNGEMVYNGKCHFVEVSPVGEYGNSKRVSIYKDVRCWHQIQKYISEDVEIREAVK